MTANLAVSVAEQLKIGNTCEFFEFGSDDAEEESKDAKEKAEKEKEPFTYAPRIATPSGVSDLANLGSGLFNRNEVLISECHASIPEFPPEA